MYPAVILMYFMSAAVICLLKEIVDIYTQNKILMKFNNKLSKPVEINKKYAKAALFHLHCSIYT